MKVLHIIPSISEHRGGPTQVVLNLVKSLRKQGINAEIATTNDNGSINNRLLNIPFNQQVEYQGVPVWFFPVYGQSVAGVELGKDRGFLFSMALTRWLQQHIREYDILDNHYLFSYASTCAGVLARWSKVPYTVRAMGQLSPWALAQSQRKKQLYATLIERRNLNRAAAVHCTSLGEVEDVRNFGVTAPTLTLPLGVQPTKLLVNAKDKLRHLYNIDADQSVVLFLSRLHYKKRPDILIKALHQLRESGKKFHLLLAGSGESEYCEFLKSLIHQLNLSCCTTFLGFMGGQDKDLLLQGSDVFVLPSFSENFGIAVAEAMMAGLPVIVTPEVQISPDVINAQAGWVIPGTVEDVAEAIAQCLDHPQLRLQYGENGARFAQKHYCWDTIAQDLATAYQEIIQRHS